MPLSRPSRSCDCRRAQNAGDSSTVSLEALGNLGDFLGSVGVLISLVYLAVQIRKSTETERAATYRAIVADFGHMNEALAGNPELTRLYVQALEDFGALTPTERAQASQVFYMNFRYFENMYYQSRKGYLEDEVWIGWKRLMLTYFARPGFQLWWRARRDVFSEPFVRFLESGRLDRPIPTYQDVTQLGSGAPTA